MDKCVPTIRVFTSKGQFDTEVAISFKCNGINYAALVDKSNIINNKYLKLSSYYSYDDSDEFSLINLPCDTFLGGFTIKARNEEIIFINEN